MSSQFTATDVVISLAIGLAVFVVARLFLTKKTYGGYKLPPREQALLPFLGSIASFGAAPVQWLQSMQKKHGDMFSATILGKEMTFITHPRKYQVFFDARDDELSIRDVYRFITPVFGRGVVYDAELPVFMQQLAFVSRGMGPNAFRRFVSVFSEEVDFMAKQLGYPDASAPKQVETFDMLSDLIIFTASRCLLGDGVRQHLSDKNMAKLYHEIDHGISPLSFFFPFFPFPSNVKRDAARAQVAKIFQMLIDERKQQLRTSSGEDLVEDVLTELICGKYKSGESLPDEHIIGVLIAGLFGGQHTSSITSAWTLMNIIDNKAIYEKVMQEQEEVFDSDLGAELTFEKAQKMEYLESCMREALRMYPPLIMLFRKVRQARVIDGTIIPPGHIIGVSPSLTGRCGDIYENPEVFNPDRLDSMEQILQKYPFANIPFGAGRHKCVGENFAILQVKSIMSLLLRKYHWRMTVPMPAINYLSMVVGPTPPCTISYHVRKESDGFKVL